ncbi:hypothetical protein Tco_0738502 [Tanacetum coccineum]
MQQKEESFQSNKPCKNQESPEFREIFEINDLKAQLQAKTTLIYNMKNQIKSVKEASNEPKVKHDIDVLKTINIELESSVAKLLAENEKINKENERLTQTYKDLYDFVKKTRIQTKDHNDSLIAQVNSKTIENADLKAQIQEKVFANVALKNELRKLKGNSVDTKFAKPSILGELVLQPPKNQSIVRQPTAFKSERPRISKPRFASQVDVNNYLSKLVTTHYLPKERESSVAKPHHMIAPGSSRYSSNDMVHNHYLEEAKKKTQERGRNSRPSVMPSAKSQSTTNGSKPKPRNNTQTSRNWPASKNSFVTTKTVPIAEHSRNSRNFSDTKHFVCSTCQKCVFNANHDSCVTKFLNEVNSRAKVPSNKTTNRNKPVEQTSFAKKPERQIPKGHRFSIKKTFVVHEKTMTPRSCLRWKPTGKIFKTVGLRWIPTGKIFTSSTTKVDSEPTNGSNDDITNQYECKQTLDVSAVMTSDHNSSELGIHDHSNEPSSSKLVPNVVPLADKTATSQQELELLFHHHITMLRTTIAVQSMIEKNDYKGIMPTKIELTLEQSQQGVSNDVLNIRVILKVFTVKMEILLELTSNKLLVAEVGFITTCSCSIYKGIFYKHQDSKNHEKLRLKTKTSANSDIKDNSSEIKLRGRLLASFQDDAKYEHVGQDTRSQGVSITRIGNEPLIPEFAIHIRPRIRRSPLVHEFAIHFSPRIRRLSTTFKPKEPTFQVTLDVLSLTPFYQAFLITASVPAVYMHEFRATTSYHKHSIRFKLNNKIYSFDLETFKNMLQICLNLLGQKFVDPPFEEEILNFMRELCYSGNIKLLSDVKVDLLPQPWRTLRTIINKCLSGKVTGIDSLCLSRAQILWGLYHKKKVDYVYLLW